MGITSLATEGLAIAIPTTALVTDTAGVKMPSAIVRLCGASVCFSTQHSTLLTQFQTHTVNVHERIWTYEELFSLPRPIVAGVTSGRSYDKRAHGEVSLPGHLYVPDRLECDLFRSRSPQGDTILGRVQMFHPRLFMGNKLRMTDKRYLTKADLLQCQRTVKL